VSRFTGIRYGGCLLSTCRLQRIILRERPDLVHLQCINGNFVNIYRLVRWLKEQRIKTVLTLHAEFMYTANCGYAFDCEQWKKGCRKCPDKYRATKSWFADRTAASWKRMYKAFSGFEEDCMICPVSPWTQSRAKESDILKNFPCQTVYNGVNTMSLFCRPAERSEPQDNTVLNVTSYFSLEENHIKGGRYLMQLAQRMPDVTFYVAGNAEENLRIPENLVLLGRIGDQRDLAEQYRRAALSIMVSRKETFSMPCAESLCCGTPVVGFRAGAPEQISLPQYSEFVPQGDLDALEQTVRRWLERRDLDPQQIARAAGRTYSIETMVKRYIEVYGRVL
jgi:glycosyltransferase involved in cell wall biosynthesis